MSIASRQEGIRGCLSKLVAKRPLNKIRENAGIHEQAVITIDHLVVEDPVHHLGTETRKVPALKVR